MKSAATKTRTAANVIPDAWLGGYMRTHRAETIYDAIAWWQEQERMAAEFEAQRAAS